MFEQTFKNIDDILRKDAGCTSELDYTEQSSWLLFLKYLDALEHDKAAEAELEGKTYTFILAESYRWEAWAAPKTPDGKLDHNTAMTGDDLRDFVNGKLFPYLAGFKQRASGPNTIEYKIGEVFGEIKNKVQSGYNLRDVMDLVDELRFRSQTEKHELSHLYEAKIKNMGRALGKSGDGGVDGVIDQDALGLDQIYVQAKRYTDNKVSSGEIRDFFGSLDRFKANKGLFVTTSTFSPAAKETAEMLSKRIVLIDGLLLTRLMIRFDIGCRVEEVVHIKKLDEDFFD